MLSELSMFFWIPSTDRKRSPKSKPQKASELDKITSLKSVIEAVKFWQLSSFILGSLMLFRSPSCLVMASFIVPSKGRRFPEAKIVELISLPNETKVSAGSFPLSSCWFALLIDSVTIGLLQPLQQHTCTLTETSYVYNEIPRIWSWCFPLTTRSALPIHHTNQVARTSKLGSCASVCCVPRSRIPVHIHHFGWAFERLILL